MADMRRFLDLTGLGIYDAKIKAAISTGDAQALADAKKYFDDNKGLFEAAGAVKTAQEALQAAINAVDAKVNGILNGESIDSFKDVETELAKYQLAGDYATKDEAQAMADAKDEAIAAAKKAGDDAQADVNALEEVVAAKAAQTDLDALAGKVGEVPENQTVMGIIANIQENAYDDTEIINRVAAVESNKADKTQVATDIAAAVKVEEEARIAAVNGVQGNVDTLSQAHVTDKKALEDAIALKADITALNEVSAVANAAVKQADYDVKVKALEDEDARIEGLVTAEVERADKAEKANADAIKAIADDYLKGADKTELQGNIDVVSGKVTTLVGEDTGKSVRTIANEELAKQLIAEGADEALDTLTEIAAWIQSHPEDASAMNKAIDDLEALVGTLPQGITATNVVDYIAEVKDSLVAEIARLDAEKQDVITEISTTSGVKAITLPDGEAFYDHFEDTDGYGNYLISTDVIEASDVISINVSGSMEVSYDDTIGYDDVYLELGDFTVENNSLSYYHDNGAYSGSFTLNFTDNGIIANSEMFSIESFSISYNSTVEGMVVKKEHLPSDIVYQAAIDDVIGALNTANGEIAKKADKTTVEGIDGRLVTAEGKITTVEGKVSTLEGKVSTLEGKMTDVEGAVATKVEQEAYDTKVAALEDADAGQVERIAALEAKFGEGEGNVEDMIADAVADGVADAVSQAETKDEAVLAAAKKYADDEDAKIEERVGALESASGTHALASDLTALAGRVTTAEGEIDTLQSEMDAVEAVAAAAAKASDLTALAGRVGTAEGKITTLEGEMDAVEGRLDDVEEAIEGKAAQADLDALTTRVGTAETNIAANTAALAKITEITENEINALFA